MELDVIRGSIRSNFQTMEVAQVISKSVKSGSLYLGYPVLSSPSGKVIADALLLTPELGVVAFRMSTTETIDADDKSDSDEQQQQHQALRASLTSHFVQHPALWDDDHLAFKIFVISVVGDSSTIANPKLGFVTISQLGNYIQSLERSSISSSLFTQLESVTQSVTTLKSRPRRPEATNPTSRGSIVRKIEKSVSTLDRWQKRAAIESPDGPQRIRGLAGSGKTVILAWKAAYLHALHPDWTIAVTFQSRSLYDQLESLITRFSEDQTGEPPDWSKLKLLHAWGSGYRPGVYSEIALSIDRQPRNFNSASSAFGRERAFEGACQELLSEIDSRIPITPLFDALLIDEAQDLPPAFFQLVLRFVDEPKRIVWAYDELQRISETAMPSLAELFGVNPDGSPLVRLENRDDSAQQDILLKMCYRNTPWALVTAHGLGFGIYRTEGRVQDFDEQQTWIDIGYKVDEGFLNEEEEVRLIRDPLSVPEYFEELIDPTESVFERSFKSTVDQDTWVADEIVRNLTDHQLQHTDIMVVFPDARYAMGRAQQLTRLLEERNVGSHIVGGDSSPDIVFKSKSVALLHIHRAKGNEAAVVYAMDSEFASSRFNQITNRNTLFTAISRAKGWVYVLGHGSGMDELCGEIKKIKERWSLMFKVLNDEQRKQLRRLHSDASDDTIRRTMKRERELRALISELKSNPDAIGYVDKSLLSDLRNLLSKADSE